MNKKIIIIDYGLGNILSIKNAVNHHGYEVIVTNEKKKKLKLHLTLYSLVLEHSPLQ